MRTRPALANPLFLVIALLAARSAAQTEPTKIPRPLPFQADVKSPATPRPATAQSPEARERPLEPAAPSAARPPKLPVADGAPDAPAFEPDFSQVTFDEPGDGALWARGRTYKARFDAASATYIPFFGSCAPRNFPVRAELVEASAGGAALALEQRGVSRAGDDVTIDRGALREVWHLETDSAEQSFVLASRPAAGDLSLRIALDSELAARATDGGVELANDLGSVRIGRAVVLDAAGRRLEIACGLEDGALALRVPAEFVASATYPLVVDPLYSAYTLDSSGRGSLCDIANAGSSGYWGAVYQYSFSATDADVWAVDLYYGTVVAGSGVWVDNSGWSWLDPRVAYNALNDRFLTVATVRPTPSSSGEIWCRSRVGTGQGLQKQIQSSTNGSCFYADVGGDPALTGPTYFLVVWTRNFNASDWDIHGRLVDYDGNPLGTSPIYIENSVDFDWHPRISKTDGRPPFTTQEWNVVWMKGQTTIDIWGARIHWDGSVTSPAFPIDQITFYQDMFPAASSQLDGGFFPRPWMVAFERDQGTGNSRSDIEAEVLVGTTVVSYVDVSGLEGGWQLEDQRNPDLDSNGQRFVLSYTESYNGSTTDHDLYVATLHWADGAIGLDEGHVLVDFSADDTQIAQVSCDMTQGNAGYPYYGLIWANATSSTTANVYTGTYYEPASYDTFCYGDGSAGACPCGNISGPGRGCPNSVTNGAFLYPSGNNAVSADTFVIAAIDLPPGTTCLFFQGTIAGTGSVFGDGLRCVNGTVVRIGAKTASGGNANYPEPGDPSISYRGLVPADGGSRAYQVWYRNSANFCTPAAFNLSSGVRVLWLR